MIPELAIAMLACARIGATHSVVFGGFSAEAHPRSRATTPARKLIITADGGWRRGKVVPLKANVDAALAHGCPTRRERAGACTRTGERGRRWPERATCAGTSWSPRQPAELRSRRRSTASTRCSSSTPRAPPASPRAWCTRPAATRVGVALHHRAGLRPARRRHLLVHRRHRLGHRPQLRRLRPARERRDDGDVRGRARHARARIASGRSSTQHEVTIFYTAPTAIRAFMRWGDE